MRRQSAAKGRGPSFERRIHNINWVENLAREGLSYGQVERQILIYRTTSGESLYIQFPGKESTRQASAHRPWDFRPVLVDSRGMTSDDLSFYDIWDAMYVSFESFGNTDPEPLRLLARLFYAMAYMTEHEQWRAESTVVRQVVLRGHRYEVEQEGELTMDRFFSLCLTDAGRGIVPWIYRPPQEATMILEEHLCGGIGSMSLEGFLYYNDLLAWNEDCKYYYRDVVMNRGEWAYNTGRVNNILTHISVLGFLLGHISLSSLLARFASRKGVGPATWDEVRMICGEFMD